ncbi:hypothetical protein LOTGIDRAFT_169899 [Lottia gigantea]|uniref:Uncharacterized protein n=1 Tax=Lottia gigantea TaxID=225164 RepID=V3YWZ2_LOTGI|nr:hypothetical protein LOTGIDRAFT_169899 [Lottia gigantea]ESO82578.1 hypothetical protein LOTGIDRAFT_169899 [Lottia gigantea]
MTNKSDENWCLVCSGSVFGEEVLVTGKDAEKLKQQFNKVLKAPIPKKPPVENICKKCDRNIRRLADSAGEAAEREIEYMRKTYRKTVQEYNAKAELRRQKLRKAAEAFLLGKPKDQEKTDDKLSVYASKWKFMAKSGAATSTISLPDSSGGSSPSWSKPASGETTPVLDFKQNWVKQVEFHMPVDDNSDYLDENFTMVENPDIVDDPVTFDKNSNENFEELIKNSEKLDENSEMSTKEYEKINENSEMSTKYSEKLNGNSEKLNVNLNTLNEVSAVLKEKADKWNKSAVEFEKENPGKLMVNFNESTSDTLNENVNNFDKNFEMLVEKSAKLDENAENADDNFEKVKAKPDDNSNTTATLVAKSDELNENSDKLKETPTQLNGKANLFGDNYEKVKKKSDELNGHFDKSNAKATPLPKSNELNENSEEFSTYDKSKEKSFELNGHFDKSNATTISTTSVSISYELNENSDKSSTSDNLKEKSEKCQKNSNETNINSNNLEDSAIPPEAKVALIENEDGGENNITIAIGGQTFVARSRVSSQAILLDSSLDFWNLTRLEKKVGYLRTWTLTQPITMPFSLFKKKTAEDGVKDGVKGENVKLNVKDGGANTNTEGGDVNAANDDVNTNTADGGIVTVGVTTTSGKTDEDAGSKDEKKNEKTDDKENEKNSEEKNDDKKNDVNTDDGNSDVKDEKVRSVKDAVKEIEGEDGGGDKSTVNGTVMPLQLGSKNGPPEHSSRLPFNLT